MTRSELGTSIGKAIKSGEFGRAFGFLIDYIDELFSSVESDGSKWYTGSGSPSSGLGVVGDFYLRSSNGEYFEKTATTTWTSRGNLSGPPAEVTVKTLFSSAQQVEINDDSISAFGSGIGSRLIESSNVVQNQIYKVTLRSFVSINLPDNLLISLVLNETEITQLTLAAAILDTTNDEPIDIIFYIGVKEAGENGKVIATGECFNRLYDNHIIVGSSNPVDIDFTEDQEIDVIVTSQGINTTWVTGISIVEQSS